MEGLRLSSTEIQRYSRQLILPALGAEGQFKLRDSKVLIIGLGGLGCPVASYIAGAGVGMVDLMDHDIVQRSNLHRQPLYSESDLGKPKAEVAADRIAGLNPETIIGILIQKASALSLQAILPTYDLVLDCTDNIQTKFLINDQCMAYGVALCHAGALGFDAQVLSVLPGKTPCLRCVFGDIADQTGLPTCAEAGVLGPVVGAVGSIMAVEALKILAGIGTPLFGRLLYIDMATMSFRVTHAKHRSGCRCRDAKKITSTDLK